MKIFYGSAIQGAKDREERVKVHKALIDLIKEEGHEVKTEHILGKDYNETAKLLEESIGPLPPIGPERTIYVRRKMIESVESDIDAAIFEVSTPSLGTGIEIAHAYLRPRMGLKEIPVLALYEKDYWPNKLSSMIKGITEEELPHFKLKEYENLEEAKKFINEFITT